MNLVIFGASGDLTRRKLVPALYRLRERGALPRGLRVFGFSRSEMSDEQFRRWLRDGMVELAGGVDDATWNAFAPSLHSVAGDLGSAEDFQRFAESHAPIYEAMGISVDEVLKHASVFQIEKTINK